MGAGPVNRQRVQVVKIVERQAQIPACIDAAATHRWPPAVSVKIPHADQFSVNMSAQ